MPHETGGPSAHVAFSLDRYRGTVDAFELAGTVERVNTATRPEITRSQGRKNLLVKFIVVDARDLGQSKGDTVSAPAILNRPNEPAASSHNASRRPGRCDVDQNGISPMRHPGAEKGNGRPKVERVGEGPALIPHRRHHPPALSLLEQSRIARSDTRN